MTTTATSTSSTDLNSVISQAGQSIISGSTKSTLDVDSLVSALVTAKTAGQASTISKKQTKDNTELSAIGQIKSALSALQTALTGLANGSSLSQLTATPSGSGLTVTTQTGATAGNYSIQVQNLATASKISSQAITSSDSIAAGSLNITLGSNSPLTVNVTAGESLSDIAASINSASGNPGVTATVLTAADGQHLVFQSNATGAANTVSVSGTGVNAKLTGGYTTVTTAQDASIKIDGNTVTSASNTITGALTGVTINLSSAAVGTTQTVAIANDTSASTTAINNFVTAYKNFVTTASSLASYDTSTSTAGPLLGDSMLNSITSGLATAISSGVTTGGKTVSLSSIGINLQPDGTLQVDATALQTALTSNSGAVSAVFNTTNGIGVTLNNLVNTYTQASGVIDQRTSALNTDLQNLQDQSTNLQNYQTSLTAQYNAQFTALNTLMAQMQSNTQYLTQLFGGSNSSGTLAANK
ncbi:flagellar filament capping protein FliD [Paraburkholderia phymatum]|uniref:Flagellar filament capping protein FliD n=1 Tax=Paraburkholderia phymatum TaxID=148447 RepID=A0ACC6UCL2_9BURK